MRKKRHNYTPEEKVSILRRHLVEHVAVSDLCDEYQLQPKIFYIYISTSGRSSFSRTEQQHLSVKIVHKNVLKKPVSSNSKPS
jgi:transposase-like protein